VKGIKAVLASRRAVEEGRRTGSQGARYLRTEDAARQAPHSVRRCAGT
jgi:hypothetical protein